MPNVYRVQDDGEVEAKWVDQFRLPQAFAEGWTTVRPTGPTADLSLPIMGWPRNTPMLADVKETIALLFLAYLYDTNATNIQSRPEIIDIKESGTVSATGNPRYLVTWTLGGFTRPPSQVPSLQQFGTQPATSSPFAGARWGPTMTEEITLYPDEARSGHFRVTPTWKEPGVELEEMRQQILDTDNAEAGRQIALNDQRLSNLFADLADGRKPIFQVMQEMSKMVGWDATQKLFQWSNYLVEGGLGLAPGFLPHLSRYNILNIGEFLQDLESAVDPRYLEGTAMKPKPFFQGRWGPGVKDPARVDTLTWQMDEIRREYGEGDGGTSPGTLWGDIELPPNWDTMDEHERFAWLMMTMLNERDKQTYVPPDRDSIYDLVKSTLVSLVGTSNEGRVQLLTDLYMNVHAAQAQGGSADPMQAVLNAIRVYPEYKRIHALRPEFVDEKDWLGWQFQQLMSSGMRTGAVGRRAITQAIAGVNPYNAVEAAQTFEFQETGRPLPLFLENLRNAIQNLSRALP